MLRDIRTARCPSEPFTWRNWSNHQPARPVTLLTPRNIQELVQAVVQSPSTRACGSSWSYTDVCPPDSPRMISLTKLTNVLPLPDGIADASRHAHVEAGIPLYALCEHLWGNNQVLRTMGGSAGQTLAGAINTGTHGSDFDRKPVADQVKALHLVGAGGHEYWIERGTQPLTASNPTSLPSWEDDVVEVIRSDDIFLAALVAVGRMGIVYSYVMEVETEHLFLDQEVSHTSWPQLRAQLAALGRDLRAAQADNPQALSTAIVDLIQSRFGANGHGRDNMRFIKIAMDPYSDQVYLTRRWNAGPASDFDPVGDPRPYWQDKAEVDAAKLGQGLLQEDWAAQHRSAFAKRRPDGTRHGRYYHVQAGKAMGDYEAQYHAFFYSPNKIIVDGLGFAFDASENTYLEFIDALRERWLNPRNTGNYKAGYFTLRFTQASDALIAMQQFPLAVQIELGVFSGFHGTPSFVDKAIEIAQSYGGIPHWGLLHKLTGAEVETFYGERVHRWRASLAALTNGTNPQQFSNPGSRRAGLEVTPDLSAQALSFRTARKLAGRMDRGGDMWLAGHLSKSRPNQSPAAGSLQFKNGGTVRGWIEPDGQMFVDGNTNGGEDKPRTGSSLQWFVDSRPHANATLEGDGTLLTRGFVHLLPL